MVTIEELLSGDFDAITSASLSFKEETLDLVRQAPEGLTAYDIFLAQMIEQSSEDLAGSGMKDPD